MIRNLLKHVNRGNHEINHRKTLCCRTKTDILKHEELIGSLIIAEEVIEVSDILSMNRIK